MKHFISLLLVSCTLADILQQIRPGAHWLLQGQTLTWLDQTPKPTDKEIADGTIACQLLPPPITLEDRVSAIEAHQDDQDTAISAIATKTGTVVILPSPVQEVIP